MGTWGIGPFENDMAADFSYTLDEAADDERENIVRATLIRTIETDGYLGSNEGCEAVASAALIAAQCPGGEPITTAYGPDQPLPAFSADLRALAVLALDRVLAADSELVELWDDTESGLPWWQGVGDLRAVLLGTGVDRG
jgi:hypothetical protein